MMHGHPGQTAEVKRTEGAMDILAQNPDMTLLDEQTADWDRAEAMTLMENWIQAYGDQINAVFCQNDEMALGALNALVQAGKKDNVLVVGVDAIDDALQSVKDGKMVTNGGRVLGVTATAPTLDEAIRKAYADVKKISFDKVHYRTDIGVK